MYPANQYMDPYHSHYRNHTPYPFYPPPRWETGHPPVQDSSYQPPSYGPWPYNAGMHHPHPPELHCCCNHTYSPGYYSFRPSFPQELPPSHLYYHGPFPQHLNAGPSYFAPPHPYPVDQTPYDHDKFKSHCCGCPNHVCHGTEKSNVKIEEERPDVKLESEQKDAVSGSIIHHPNSQYPFMWLPSGNMEGKENGRRYELPPQLFHGWAPVSSKRIGDVRQQEQDNQKEKQFQWPIVWMPAEYDEPKQRAEELKEMDEDPKVSEKAPRSPKIKVIPLSWFENGHHDQKLAAKDGSGDHNDKSAVKSQPATTEHRDGTAVEGNHKTTPILPQRINDERKPARETYRTIPVMPEKETDEKKVRTIPVVTQKESNEKQPCVSEKKEVKKASNAAQEGAAKHSKLPPVCLRVDPLPRKKSRNGSSRSPSPPTRKDADKAKEDVKEVQSQNLEPKYSDTEKSPNEMKGELWSSNETMQAASVKHSQEEESPTSKDGQKVQVSSTSVDARKNAGTKSLQGDDTQENAGAESLQGDEKRTDEDEIMIQNGAAKDDARTRRTNLSEPDAAVLIQSAYRGYDVRRWQTLDKLRKIRDVHEQMQGVRKQLMCLESSSKKPTEKEQVAIGETIMNLLLKLDTIQGLHPSVREARKSVARDLICLQENLDTLCKQPSGEFNHTNSEEDKPERAENGIQTAAPTLTAEASDKEEKAVGLGKAEEPSSVDSMEPGDAVPSGVPMEARQDADASEQKNRKEESCTTTMEVAHEEGKAAGQVEFQGASSMDMMSDAVLPEHPTQYQEHGVEESNAISAEQVTEEEKPVAMGEEQVAPLVDSLEPLHDATSSRDCSGQKQCTTSSVQNLHAEELITGVSPAAAEDTEATMATAYSDSGLVADKDGSAGGQMREAVGVESPEPKHDVSAAEEDQHKESSASAVNLEDSLVSLKDEGIREHDLTPAGDSIMSNTEHEPEETRDIKLQVQVVDTTQDSTKEPDGTPEASMDDIEPAASSHAEQLVQAPLLEATRESNSAPEQTVLEESEDAVQCEVSGKDDLPDVDRQNELTVDKLTGGSANGDDPLLDIQESHPNLLGEAEDTRGETVFPDLDSCGLSCTHEGAITGYDRPEMKVSSESQTDAQEEHVCLHSSRADVQVSQTDECNEMLKEASVGTARANSAEEVDVRVSQTDECNETPKDAPGCTTEANSTEEEADNPKEDVSVQTENNASEETVSASATPGGLKGSEEKKLAEENQKLKELLQKLLASGNDQMGIITDLSEKVKVLERKLARKKRPKVRVCTGRPGMRRPQSTEGDH